jgi:hypothetical protein
LGRIIGMCSTQTMALNKSTMWCRRLGPPYFICS